MKTFLQENDKIYHLKLFDHQIITLIKNKKIDEVENLKESDFIPRGQTALLDTLGFTIQEILSKKRTNVLFYNSDNTTAFHICKLANVSAGDTLIALGKDAPIYLEEGDKIQALASAASDLEIIVSYEEMDD